MNISLIAFTQNGGRLCKKIEKKLVEDGNLCTSFSLGEHVDSEEFIRVEQGLSQWAETVFYREDALIFIGAAGIAVRAIAPYIRDKRRDPAVIVADEKGAFVIPVLSGHMGGANGLATRIAEGVGGVAVITTATDINHQFAVDVWAAKNGFYIDNMKMAKQISAHLLAGKALGFYSYYPMKDGLPTGFFPMEKQEAQAMGGGKEVGSCIVLSHESFGQTENLLQLIPKTVYVGMGCRKGIPPECAEAFLGDTLEKYGIRRESIALIASIDLKEEEEALCLLAAQLAVPFKTYSPETLSKVQGAFTPSAFVKKTTGVDNVCERAAVMGSGGGRLILKKEKRDGMTIALALKPPKITFE
ncbi:MAG: cobalt-precorrin 5A hydrolase [Anaerovorax sp.]